MGFAGCAPRLLGHANLRSARVVDCVNETWAPTSGRPVHRAWRQPHFWRCWGRLTGPLSHAGKLKVTAFVGTAPRVPGHANLLMARIIDGINENMWLNDSKTELQIAWRARLGRRQRVCSTIVHTASTIVHTHNRGVVLSAKVTSVF